MRKSIIIGAGGHTRSLLSLCKSLDIPIDGIYDDAFVPDANERIMGVPLLGTIDQVNQACRVLISSGNPTIKSALFDRFRPNIFQENLIDATALVRPSAHLGNCNQLFPAVFINAQAKIGNHNLINSKALIEHESTIGHHCHISVGVLICGRVTVGDRCYLGAGSIVKDGVSICDDVVLGAGAVVVQDIVEPGTYVGLPAKKIA